MVRLCADAQHPTLAHGIPALRDIADLPRGQDKIFVTHDLGHGGYDFWSDPALNLPQLRFPGRIPEDVLPEFAHGHASDGPESFFIECLEDEATDIVRGRIDQRLLDYFCQR